MKKELQRDGLRRMFLASNKDQSLGLPRKWKVIASTIILLFTMGIGQMWGQTLIEADDMETTSGSGSSFAVSGFKNDNCSGIAQSAEARTGSYSLITTYNGSGEKAAKSVNTSISVSANSYLHTIAWTKLESTDETAPTTSTQARIRNYVGGNGNGTAVNLTTTWTQITSAKKAGSNQSSCYVQLLRKHASNGAVLFDDVVIYVSTNATTDIVAPEPATSADATTSAISWTCGSDANTGIANTLIWRRTTGTANDLTLNNQGKYVVPAEGSTLDQSGHWTLVSATVAADAESYSGTFAAGDVYAIVHRDLAYNYSEPEYVTIPGGGGGDTDAPTFVSSVPANSATNQAVSGTIVLTFSEDIADIDDSKFSLSGATIGTVAIDGTDATKVNVPYSGASNESTVTLSVAAGAVEDAAGNALETALSDIAFTTVAAGPTTPTLTYNDGVYTIGGSDLDLSTLIETKQSNGTITYSVKTDGDTDASIDGVNFSATAAGTATITASQAADGETYLATTAEFDVVVSAAAPAPTPCATLTPATSGASPTAIGQEALLQEGSTGGRIVFASYKTSGGNTIDQSFTYTSRGLQLNKGGDDKIRVELNHLIQEGTVITVNMNWSRDDGKASGLVLRSGDDATAVKTMTMVDPSGAFSDSYEVQSTDTKLIGNNSFILARSNSVGLTSVTVSNCGAELHELTSAVDPVHDPAYATVTLSKSLIAEGATATATYSAIDAAYDFDEWQISGATIDDAHANPVTITMGSTDATITLKLKAAAVKHKVTYYDNTTKLGEEDINEGSNPTGAGLAPHKLGYTFAGWSTINGGAATALSGITVSADMPLYAVWNAVNCATKTGTIYTMEIAVAPAENCTIKTASGFESTLDLYQYEGIVGGEAMIGNTGSSNNCILQTNKTILLKDNVSYLKLDFDCPLAKDDKIQSNISGNTAWISTEATRPSGTSTALAVLASSSTGEFVIPAASDLIGAQTIYIWKGGGNATITSINIARPVKHTVSFNMNGHGDAIDPQYVVDGAKATEPTPAPTASGYRFVEWQLSGSAYDFDAAVTADITLDAVWQQVWTVTFNSDGGSDIDAQVVDAGGVATVPDPAPTKGGYDFVEWRKEGESVAYNFATAVTANITLVAQWEVAQDDASLSALSYNSNAIDVSSAEDVSGVQTYTIHLPWGSTVNAALISVTKNAESADMSAITYDSENKRASFMVTSGNGLVSINYAIQFVIDAKRGTSIIKATTNNVVTGLIGGTIDQSYSGNANSRKMNKGNYFGVTLANDETFQEGDVIIINITAPADLGKFMVYADAERTELVADQGIVYTKPEAAVPVLCPTGEMMMTLPVAANGKRSLYLSRENGDTQWNVTFSSLEVVREMSPAIKSFKFGESAATINEAAKTIAIEVPFATDVTALTPTVEAYGNNGATYTPSGAQDFTSPVNYVVTDAYSELSTTYAVTVTKAPASENANLASLAVAGYSLDFDPATTSYNIVLDYGTTVLPAITYEVAEVGLATAEKVEGSVNSATTITVTPEAGAGYEKVYTINFSVSTNPKYVIYDGSTMTNIASATGADGSTGFSYSLASNIPLSGDAISSSWGGKDYTHAIKGFKPNDNSSNIVSFVIPEGYVAKVRLVGSTNSDTKERKLFIAMSASKDAADALDNYIITSSTYDAQGFVTDYLLPNTYYLGSTDSYRLFEFSIQLYPIDYSRNVTQGRFGTICLPNGGVMVGADLYEVAYYGETSKKIFFDEILSGVMEAGVPYVFLPQEGVNKLAVVYTDDADAAATSRNGLVGFIGADEDDETSVPAGMYILQNNQYREVLAGADARIKSYRAYINLGAITPTAPALAPGRRRISMGVASENSATGMDELNASETPVKMMIDGQLYILRGEKLYDATGRLVK